MDGKNKSVVEWALGLVGEAQSELVVQTAFSEVWRIRGGDGVYYAKRVIGALRSEPLMCRLIERVAGPGVCPEVVDLDHDAGFFLTRALGGLTLREKFDQDGFDVRLACRAYEGMVELQGAMSSSFDECVELGSDDWRSGGLGRAFLSMLDAPGFAETHRLGAQEIDAARRGADVLARSIDELASLGLGECWSDDDLNDKNMVMVGDGFGFVDLGETSIGPPFIGLYASIASLRQKRALADGSQEDLMLRDACLGARSVPASQRAQAWAACQMAMPIYGAVCLNRLMLSASSELLLDPRYTWRMRDTLGQIAR